LLFGAVIPLGASTAGMRVRALSSPAPVHARNNVVKKTLPSP
jgi:hypothetical protein